MEFEVVKTVFFMSCLEMVKIHIVDTDFNDISTNSKRGFEPFGLDDRVHYFRHPVNEFLSLFHWTGIPNACQSVFPHDHCSPLVGVFLTYGDFDHFQTAHKKRFLPLQIPFWVTFFDFPKMTFRSS